MNANEDNTSKYKIGELVFSLTTPTVKMVVRRYYARIYYCTETGGSGKEHAYFESEIRAVSSI